ncbi:carotenoid oxygenase family protein [Streptomyces sp. IBSBF 2390]|uniref:carotenoid oxygenase family protein n=1 Tax=Streptomyces sp. IBSBF 2390 TaxID=2903533 RepID=UPI002FDBF81B
MIRYDRTTGARRIHRAGDARLPSEAVFVPAEGVTREDDGYLLTMVCDLKQDASQLLVLDASGLDPIATVHLPHRVTAASTAPGSPTRPERTARSEPGRADAAVGRRHGAPGTHPPGPRGVPSTAPL